MTATNDDQTSTSSPLPFTFGGFTIPEGCRRIFITAELEPSNGDPRIQPTGFPDLGPVLYADPAERDGLICLIESEASMANRLEEVCLADKYEGTLRAELNGIPYIKLTDDGTVEGTLITASTIDGHRFASEYIMGGHVVQEGPELDAIRTTADAAANATGNGMEKKGAGREQKREGRKPDFVRFVQSFMGMPTKDRCPASNVPRVFQLAMEYDPLSLLHGFQISVKDKLTFVGLRSPRAITASIVGLNCQRIVVPGVRIDPIGTGDAGQAIFQKPRVSAKRIEARFSIDVGLLAGMYLGPNHGKARLQLLLALAICKVSWFLDALKHGLRLRTDCDLRTVTTGPNWWEDRLEGKGAKFDTEVVLKDAGRELPALMDRCEFKKGHSPFPLKHVRKTKEERDQGKSNSSTPDQAEEAPVGSEDSATD